MTYKSKEKSFFEDTILKEKQGFANLEKKGARKVLKWYDFGASSLRVEIKKHPAQYFFLFISTFLGSVITSSLALLGFSGNLLTMVTVHNPPQKSNAVQVAGMTSKTDISVQKFDPLLLASKLRKNEKDFVIIDIRSAQDYKKGHILTASNLPIYNTALVTKNGDLDGPAVKKAFEPHLTPGKLIILYGQNAYSSLSSDIANLLTTEENPVKALAIGWDEWLHLESK